MRACKHAHPCSLFKLERKQLIDRLLHLEKMLIVYSSQNKRGKVVFLYSMLFYSRLNRFVLFCGFVTFLWLMM